MVQTDQNDVKVRKGLRLEWSLQRTLAFAGATALILCGLWWAASIQKNRMVKSNKTWVPAREFLGLDFMNNYHAARHWLNGGNPYTDDIGDPLKRPFVYSPLLLWIFSWTAFFSVRKAVLIWMLVVAVLATIGGVTCWQTRRRLGLWPVPLIFVLAATLCSFPIAYALERANCDVLVLALILMAAAALAGRALWQDGVIGLCVALAIWIKVYPAVLLLGLVALRRWRAAGLVLATYVVIGIIDWPMTLEHVQSTHRYVSSYDVELNPTAHPLGTYWKRIWEGTRLARLGHVPGAVAAIGLLLPGMVVVSWSIYRCTNPQPVLFPFLAWLTAVGTFLPPVSNDYNLFFLPMAALAVWDQRDRLIVHLLMAPLLLWWQPLQLAIGPALLFGFKLMGLVAVGLCLIQRCRDLNEALNNNVECVDESQVALAA